MANYTSIYFDIDTVSGIGRPAVQINNSETDVTVDYLNVEIDLIGPSDWIPTHYKVWNIDGVTTSGDASWVAWPTVSGTTATITGTLCEPADPPSCEDTYRYIYAEFRNTGLGQYTGAIESDGQVQFSWDAPLSHSSWDWTESWYSGGVLGSFGNNVTNTMRSIYCDNILDPNSLSGLTWTGRDFSDVEITCDTISIDSLGYAGSLLRDPNSSIGVDWDFSSSSRRPLIWVDLDNSGSYTTVTTWSGTTRSALSGTDYDGIVSGYDWGSTPDHLYFDIEDCPASDTVIYGFTFVDNVEFDSNSPTGGYNGETVYILINVLDDNGTPVEGAPVNLSLISGDAIGSFVGGPTYYTDADGLISAPFSITDIGFATLQATIEGFTITTSFYSIEFPANLERSLLRQYEQIRWSATYDDAVSSVNTSAVAEPSTDAFAGDPDDVLQHDMNVLRTIVKQLKGGSDWYSELGSYFNPANTTSGDAELETFDLESVRNETLNTKTILVAVSDDNSGSGYTTASGDAGLLIPLSLSYATWLDRRGVPVYASTANTGIYADEGVSDDVVAVDVLDTSTGGEFATSSGHTVYGRFYDGEDQPTGSGTGTDVYLKFYADEQEYTFTENDPTNVMMVYPYRKILSDLEEYEWTRTDFVSSWEGDEPLIEDIVNLWDFTGAIDGQSDPAWTNTSGNYVLDTSPTSLEDGLNTLNDELGNRIFSNDYYITSGETHTANIDDLDQAIDALDDQISGAGEKYVEALSADIPADTLHTLPNNIIYTPVSGTGQAGKLLNVYIDGQLLAASTGLYGVNSDRDYAETNTSGITFHMDVHEDSNITYFVKSE